MNNQGFMQRLRDNRELGVELLRIYLGIGLLVRGLLFVNDPQLMEALVGEEGSFDYAVSAIGYYVGFAHIAGGALLAVGLLTRTAALVQVPILLGAVFFVHMEEGLFTTNPNQSLEFAALVLVLLLVFSLYGGGRWSADNYIFRKNSN